MKRNTDNAKSLTASQQKTLNYVLEHGRIMLDALSFGGYSTRSAASLIRMGLLVEIKEPYEVRCDDGRIVQCTETWAAAPDRKDAEPVKS